jgi:acyl-[acyl-carrier-protein]-phospholipid O-acyltransferase/long-chain-fatty-acid--[acyl-carrier-protein] ligase
VPLGAAMLGVCSIMVGNSHSVASISGWLVGVGFSGGLFIVPLNAYLQERAGASEKGRLLATNNFANMIGVIAASGSLYLLHDVAHWTPASILIALGILTLASTVYIAWLVPAPLVRFLAWSVTQILFRIRVVGAEHLPKTGGALLVSNHVSYADAVLIGCATDRLIRFLMWQPMYDNRWLRPVCRLFDAIPIPTNAPKESLRALRHARQQVEAGNLVGIFPEGGLTRTSHVRPFERGVEVILRGLESTPVIPIYLDGLWGHPLSTRRGLWRLRHRVTISIGEPIYGPATAEVLHQKVLELGCAAAEHRKDRHATPSYLFGCADSQDWSRRAAPTLVAASRPDRRSLFRSFAVRDATSMVSYPTAWHSRLAESGVGQTPSVSSGSEPRVC